MERRSSFFREWRNQANRQCNRTYPFRIIAAGESKKGYLVTPVAHQGVRASRPQVGETVPERRMSYISDAFLNRENTKKREIHEIFASRIS